MQNPQCKICPYCKSVQSLDSRYCSQCSEILDDSTYSTLFKHKNTILITALGTTCAFLVIVLFVFLFTKPGTQDSSSQSNTNKQTNSVANAATTSAAISSNADLTKTKPKKSVSPIPSNTEVIPVDKADVKNDFPPVSDKTEAKRNPSGDSDIESYPSRDYQTGPRGGCYYINDSGTKTYVDRSFCSGSTTNPNPIPKGYIRGPRGGCYYINSSGNKTYVDRDLCD